MTTVVNRYNYKNNIWNLEGDSSNIKDSTISHIGELFANHILFPLCSICREKSAIHHGTPVEKYPHAKK